VSPLYNRRAIKEPSVFVVESSGIIDSIMTMLDPVRLVGLKQAMYVMECLTKGQSEQQIANTMGDDKQLVRMWISFLQHNHWMESGVNGWFVTTKGAAWINRYNSQTD